MKQTIALRKQMCRRLIPRQLSWKEVFPHITTINDPKKLAELNAEVQRRKLGLALTDNSKGEVCRKM